MIILLNVEYFIVPFQLKFILRNNIYYEKIFDSSFGCGFVFLQ